MLDQHLLRSSLEEVRQALAKRGFPLDVAMLEQLEARRKKLQVETQQLQAERNSRSKLIGQYKAAGKDIQPIMDEVAGLGDRLKLNENALDQVQAELDIITQSIPNIPHASVPVGKSEADNVEQRRWGTVKQPDFTPLDHVDLGESLGLLDFETATTIASARFVIMKAGIARLHRA